MKNNRLIRGLIYTACVAVIVFIFLIISTTGSSHINHTSLKIVLGQTPEFNLSLKEISLEDSYPLDYRLNIPKNYYSIKLLGKDKVLYTGKIANQNIIISDIFDSENDRLIFQEGKNNIIKETPDEITLYLPYFKDAESVLIYDEYGSLKLAVNLKDYSLSIPKSETNLCGNGICDTNENIISCFSDCRNAPKWIWNNVSNSFLP